MFLRHFCGAKNRFTSYYKNKWRKNQFYAKAVVKMIDKEIDSDNQALIHAISQFPEGVPFETVFNMCKLSISRRTAQRRLAALVNQSRVIKDGFRKGSRYRIQVGDQSETYVSDEKDIRQKKIIPLSPTAESIQLAVRAPIQARKPVSYNWKFLNNYRPNVSFYIPENIRKHLAKRGQSPDGIRPAGTYAREILNRLLIDLSWNSSRLEGNTYSLLETERLFELGEASEGKDVLEAQMILNHKDAIEFIVESADVIGFNRFSILNLHALLSNNLLVNQRACGSLRTKPVSIGKSVYQPIAVPQPIDEYFQQILDTANAITNPFEQSFFAMVHLPYLQPFFDVNKRVSRLAANIPLIKQNLCPLSFVDVPVDFYVSGLLGIYELNRIELLREVYIWAYERSCALYSTTRQELGEPDPFRLRYRDLIMKVVSEIVRNLMNKKQAVAFIKQNAKEIEPIEQANRFIEVVETELMSLHEGNIARYRLRLSEYQTWKQSWN